MWSGDAAGRPRVIAVALMGLLPLMPVLLTVLVVTAGLALWNMGAAYLAGIALHHAIEQRLIRL